MLSHGGSGRERELATPPQAEQGEDLLPCKGCWGVGEDRCLVIGVKKCHSPCLVVKVNPNHLGGSKQGDGDGRRSESLVLAPTLPHRPDPHLGVDTDTSLPPHRLLGHSNSPGFPIAHLHLPVMPPCAETLAAQDTARRVEALGIVGDRLAGVFPSHPLAILGQDEPGMRCLWIQCQTYWGQREDERHRHSSLLKGIRVMFSPSSPWDVPAPSPCLLEQSRNGFMPTTKIGRVEKAASCMKGT